MLDLIGEDREVLKRTERVPILIRVLVLESQKTTSVGQTQKVLRVQEEIVEVNHKAVKQIKVTEVLLQLDSANNEVIERRVLTLVELEKAEIHTSPQEGDTHKYPPAEGKKFLWCCDTAPNYNQISPCNINILLIRHID